MTRPLVVVRPEPGCAETLAAARALGLAAIAAPLFAIEPAAWDVPSPQGYDAILAGSANAFRHGGAGLAGLRGLPVHAVGERTAEAARAAGFAVARTGRGGLQQVLDDMPPGRFLRLAGEARVDLCVPAGVTIDERVVYRALPLALAAEAAAALASGAVVILHSAEAAARLAREVERLALDRARIAIAALAPRVAKAAGGGWEEVTAACAVSDPALLALAAQLCQDGPTDNAAKGTGSQNGT